MTTRRNERTGDDATRIERRRPSFAPWVRTTFRTGWVFIAVLFLIILAGADLAEWWLADGP